MQIRSSRHLSVSLNLIIDKLKLTTVSVNRNLGIRWCEDTGDVLEAFVEIGAEAATPPNVTAIGGKLGVWTQNVRRPAGYNLPVVELVIVKL
jgi:hypothetical protein